MPHTRTAIYTLMARRANNHTVIPRTTPVPSTTGTSAAVYPAAYLPVEAKKNGAFVIEINLESTELSDYVDVSYRGRAGEILPELWAAVKKDLKN